MSAPGKASSCWADATWTDLLPCEGPCGESSQRAEGVARVEISYFWIVTQALRSHHDGSTRSSARRIRGCLRLAREATRTVPSPDRAALGLRSVLAAGRRSPLRASRPPERPADGVESALEQLSG